MRLFVLEFVYLIAISNVSSEKKVCQNLAPGLVTMTYGVDIIYLDQFPVEAFTDDGFRQSIFEYTCNLKLNWTDPFDEKTYSVPDQVAQYSVQTSADLDEQISISSNLQKTKDNLAINLKIGGGKKNFGSLSLSGAYKRAQEEIIKEHQSIATASVKVSVANVQFVDGEEMSLSKKFSRFINQKLTQKYEDDPEMYESFLDTYGTHYYEHAKFGGYLYHKTTIRNSYLFKMDRMKVTGKIKGELRKHIQLDGKGKIDYKKTQIDEEFEENIETKFKFFGGWTDGSQLKTKRKDWLDSVRKSPWLYWGHLVPIENLIQNKTTKKQVTKASTIRRIDAFYQEWKQVLLLSNVKLSNNETKTLGWIEKELSLPPKQRNSKDTRHFLQIGESINKLMNSVQMLRDRALLEEYKAKLVSCYDIISQCNSFHCSLDHKEKFNYHELMEKINKQSIVGHKMESQKVQSLVEEASKMRSKWALKVDGCESV